MPKTADPQGVLLRVSPRGTVTLPKTYREGVELLRAVRRPDGVVELHPQTTVDTSKAWFFTDRWQRMEREADEDIAAGRLTTFDDVEEFIAHLQSL
jgi:hypothetical protein